MRKNRDEEPEVVEDSKGMVPIPALTLNLIDGKDSGMPSEIVSLVTRAVAEKENYKIPDLVPDSYSNTLKLVNKVFDDATTREEKIGPIHYADDLR